MSIAAGEASVVVVVLLLLLLFEIREQAHRHGDVAMSKTNGIVVVVEED